MAGAWPAPPRTGRYGSTRWRTDPRPPPLPRRRQAARLPRRRGQAVRRRPGRRARPRRPGAAAGGAGRPAPRFREGAHAMKARVLSALVLLTSVGVTSADPPGVVERIEKGGG